MLNSLEPVIFQRNMEAKTDNQKCCYLGKHRKNVHRRKAVIK